MFWTHSVETIIFRSCQSIHIWKLPKTLRRDDSQNPSSGKIFEPSPLPAVPFSINWQINVSSASQKVVSNEHPDFTLQLNDCPELISVSRKVWKVTSDPNSNMEVKNVDWTVEMTNTVEIRDPLQSMTSITTTTKMWTLLILTWPTKSCISKTKSMRFTFSSKWLQMYYVL